MKKHLLFSLLFLFSFSLIAQQTSFIDLSASESKLEVLSSTPDKLILNTSVDNFEWSTTTVPIYGAFTELKVEGMTFASTVGQPKFPVYSNLIEVPYGATIDVVITGYTEEVIDLDQMGLPRIIPAQPSYSKSSDPNDRVFQIDNKYYNTNALVESELVKTEINGIMRGVRIGRVEVCPYHYNPVENELIVYNNLTFEIQFKNADHVTTEQNKSRYFTPDFEPSYNMLLNYRAPAAKDAFTDYSAPLKYVIVAERMMETTLQPFVQWKEESGFNVIEAYTDVIGSSSAAITSYLQGLYDAATPSDPAPLYVLIIGDHGDIPGQASQTSSHITDLYYACYDGGGDYLPDLYYGRISASTTTELQNALDKILPYEQYTIPSGAYLNNSMMIAGVDGTYAQSHGDGTIYYIVDNYVNTSHNLTNIYAYYYAYTSGPYSVMSSNSAGAEADIESKISSGVGFANYTAHCDHDGWSDPAIRRSDIANFNNVNEYPFMIGNCCLSFEFDQNDAFGEMLLYTANEGAVGYIGTTNFSYWDEDVYWGIGLTSLSITTANVPNHNYSNTGLGVYDGVYHENGEPYADWYYTGRQMVHMGNTAVQASSSTRKQYYWEIYHCVGDPSIMPYMYEPPALSLTYSTPNIGATTLAVTTEPYTYVAISQDGVLLDVGWSGAGTAVNLSFTAINGNDLTIVGTKQNRAPYIIEDLTPINATTPPIADFVADQTVVTQGTTVNFTDLSLDYPASWDWDFPGGTPTTSTTQHPSIDYNTPGVYDVTLIVGNAAGADTLTKTNYITVNPITSAPVVDFDASVTTVNVGGTIDFTDLSTNMPIAWEWTFEGGNPASSTAQDPTGIQYDTPGVYYVKLKATNTIGSDSLTKVSYITVNVPDPCTASSSSAAYEYISNVSVGTINNTSGQSNYTDYTAQSTDMTIGTGYPLDITIGGAYASDQVLVWVDWNMDGDFEDVGEDVFSSATGTGPFSTTITPPGGASLGTTKMRIRLHDTSYGPNSTPCGTSDYGEVEDYSINVVTAAVPPTAAFSTSATSTCSGDVTFTDGSFNANSWLWDFGDGNTSTAQNPTHTYTANGTYTVTLIATNTYGADTLIQVDLITVNMPSPPSTTGASSCGDASLTLSASGSGTLEWYDAITGGTLLGTGTTYNTPVLSTTTTYYVQDNAASFGPSQYVGSTNSSSDGGNYNNYRTLIFDAYAPFKLVSVEVNASGAGIRDIELRDNGGALVQSASVNIPDGISRITLDFDVPIGTNYELGIGTGTATNLYRNNNGVTYPYEISGLVSITSSSAGANFYYFFYDWEVQEALECSSSRTPVTATIETPTTVSVSISATDTVICTGDNVIFTPTGTGGGTTPTYEWFVNGSSVGTGATYSSTGLADGDYIYCILTSSDACNDGPATSNTLNISVATSVTPAITINAPTTTICDGSLLNFSQSSSNGGSAPVYDWQLNGVSVGSGTSYSSSTFNNGDSVVCYLTSSSSCATTPTVPSNTWYITVNTPVAVTVTATASDTVICAGTNVTFNASGTNGGASPVYEWFVNSSSVGTGATYNSSTLADGDLVYCVLTSSDTCTTGPATSNSFTIDVTPSVTPTISIAASATTICEGSTVNFTSSVTNEGGAPVYDWQVNSTSVGTGTTYSSSTLTNGDVVSCVLTSSETCVTSANANSNDITMNVTTPQTVSVTIASSMGDTICDGDLVVLTPTPVNGGASPAYEWFINGSSVGTSTTISSSSFSDGDYVHCTLVSSDTCVVSANATSNTITFTVLPAPVAAFTYVDNSLTVDFTNTSTNATSYYWDFGDGNNSTLANPSYTYAANGTYTVMLIAYNACGSDTTYYNVTVTDITGITSDAGSEIQVYPNPTSGLLTVDLNSDEYTRIEIYDVIGKCHITKEIADRTIVLDMGTLANGVYYIKLYQGDVTSFTKVVVKE